MGQSFYFVKKQFHGCVSRQCAIHMLLEQLSLKTVLWFCFILFFGIDFYFIYFIKKNFFSIYFY